MKILQINKYFYHIGGSETVFFNTISLLEEHGHTVIPFTLKSDKDYESPYSTYFVDYPELSKSNLWTKIKNIPSFIYNRKAAKQLDRLIRREKPDIAQIHLMFNSMSVSILPVLKKYNIPIIMTLHDYRLICPAYLCLDGQGNVCEKCLKGASYWHCIANRCSSGNFFNSLLLTSDAYFRKYFIRPLDYVDKFIFVGEYAMKKHIASYPVYKEKSVVLHNFTAIPDERPCVKENYLLYYGRISREKGIPVLMKAMDRLPGVKLKIAGKGPLLEKFKAQAAPDIEFIGYKSGEELHEIIRKALFVIVPSVCYENNTMVIPESFLLGTPAIASRIGGIPEFVNDGKNGFLIEPGSVKNLYETITKALNLSNKEYFRMCKEARAFGETKFAKELYYGKLMSVYNEVLKRNIQ